MKRLRLSALCAFLALVSACSSEVALQRFTPPEVDARSRDFIGQFVRDQVDSATERLVTPLRTPDAAVELRKIADVLHGARFDTIRVVGAQTNTVNGVRHVNLTYELHSSTSWFLANVASVDTTGTWYVERVSARTTPQSLTSAAQFTLAGKSFVPYYLWLLLAPACAAISLGTCVFIAMQRAMPKRWRWALLSLIGVGAIRLNWATGEIDLALLQVQLASASFLRAGPVAPWIISFGIPIGAVFAIAQFRRWRTQYASAAPIQPPVPQAAV